MLQSLCSFYDIYDNKDYNKILKAFSVGWNILASTSLTWHFLFFFFNLFKAAPTAYGGSQARGWIRAEAAGLHHSHSNARSEPRLQPIYHSSRQRWILNPLSNTRDQICILKDASQIHYHWAMQELRHFLFNWCVWASIIYKKILEVPL